MARAARGAGVEYLFANGGTDLRRWSRRLPSRAETAGAAGQIVAPHENLAVGMAHGYAMVTGRPQAMMVHVDVGMRTRMNGLINASREQSRSSSPPGRTPLNEDGLPGSRSLYIHWAQEMFDQAGMIREAVKWDYELRHARQVETVIDRALSIAKSEPQGPVSSACRARSWRRISRRLRFADPRAERDRARGAGRSGDRGDRGGPDAREESADRRGDPPAATGGAGAARRARRALRPAGGEFRPRYMSLADAHPMHAGFEVDPFLEAADAILALDCDVPWIPRSSSRGRIARVPDRQRPAVRALPDAQLRDGYRGGGTGGGGTARASMQRSPASRTTRARSRRAAPRSPPQARSAAAPRCAPPRPSAATRARPPRG